MAKIGLAYNLIKPDYLHDLPFDCIAELDSEQTIQLIVNALKAEGHEVILLEADENFAMKLDSSRPEIVFNIAEGLRGECRESQVPAICESFGIPYTGSGILTLSICLNKARTNQVLSCHDILVPPFQVVSSCDDALHVHIEYPLIVKLLSEGSSMGLSKKSVVKNEKELIEQVEFMINTYCEPLLVQKFILGREFNVGVLGNQNPFTLPITEVTFQDPYGIVTFAPDDEVLPMIAQVRGEGFLKDLESRAIPRKSICPAQIGPELAERIKQTALKAFKALECRDWCRVDFRLGSDDRLYVLELNPIAGIGPGYWLPNSAEVVHLNYSGFINKILNIALDRGRNHHRCVTMKKPIS